ncbi:MAG: FdtA/QdtA family cupin domain-containing protein [Bacteroidia bacterium]|nr:FdtA/QdtA family cupin domain-containing protein [Bacteroidia bacterium]
MKEPQIINFRKIGKPTEGYISVAELQQQIPFELKRVFWTYFTPEEVVRGRHAHYETEMVLIAVAGRIVVNTEMPDGSMNVFVLDKPDMGVYMPKLCWHTMQYSHNAVQLVLASSLYNEADYVRSYRDFKELSK